MYHLCSPVELKASWVRMVDSVLSSAHGHIFRGLSSADYLQLQIQSAVPVVKDESTLADLRKYGFRMNYLLPLRKLAITKQSMFFPVEYESSWGRRGGVAVMEPLYAMESPFDRDYVRG